MQLSQPELVKLGLRIEDDYRQAKADHVRRMERFRRMYQAYRATVEEQEPEDGAEPNMRVPLTQTQIFTMLAHELDLLFGDDAEITAKPIGRSDYRVSRKVQLFMHWLVFENMEIVEPLAEFLTRKNIYGRSHAYVPYIRRTMAMPDGSIQVLYDGPGFYPMEPDELVVPAEKVRTIQDFSWVIRRYAVTIDALLRGENDGKYTNVRKNIDVIRGAERSNAELEDEYTQEINDEIENAEGVGYKDALSGRQSIRVWEWYGKWNLPKKRAGSPDLHDFKGRQDLATDLVVRYLPDANVVLYVGELAESYPFMEHKRPFVEASLVKDGTYWCMGFAELLSAIEHNMSTIHNIGATASAFAAMPTIFYEKASGYDPNQHTIAPRTAIPVSNARGINQMTVQGDLSGLIQFQAWQEANAERLTGIGDQQTGRFSDRPNAPRTATQSTQLLAQASIRMMLNQRFLRADLKKLLKRFWELCCCFPDSEMFFRVTEEDARGLFPVEGGGAVMTAGEFGGRYDFGISFAVPAYAREAQKADWMTFYQLMVANPLIIANPQALYAITAKLAKALNFPEFEDLVPRPPAIPMPKQPKEEHVAILQGEEVMPHPNDDDTLHIKEHSSYQQQLKKSRYYDEGADIMLGEHIADHAKQSQQKRMMSALAGELARTMQGNASTAQGITAPTTASAPLTEIAELLQGMESPDGSANQTGPQKRGPGQNGRGSAARPA
jgi:hypothetical protein